MLPDGASAAPCHHWLPVPSWRPLPVSHSPLLHHHPMLAPPSHLLAPSPPPPPPYLLMARTQTITTTTVEVSVPPLFPSTQRHWHALFSSLWQHTVANFPTAKSLAICFILVLPHHKWSWEIRWLRGATMVEARPRRRPPCWTHTACPWQWKPWWTCPSFASGWPCCLEPCRAPRARCVMPALPNGDAVHADAQEHGCHRS
jgi:hypothetical protein